MIKPPETWRDKVWGLGAGSLFLGLIASKFLISLSIILLLIGGLVRRDWSSWWLEFRRQPLYLAQILFFLGMGFSVLLSENWAEGWVRLRISLPFLVLPLAFAGLPPIAEKHWRVFLQFFSLVMALTLAGVLANYAWYYEEILDALRRSKAVPVPHADHIRYNLLLCLACFAAWSLAKGAVRPWFWRGLAGFMVLGLHILSVRSGLLGFYLVLAFWGLRLIWTQKRYVLGLGFILGLLTAPVLAYYALPSFRAKVELTQTNWTLYQKGEVSTYSDTRRLLSYQIAYALWREQPIQGIGLGDLRGRQEAVYRERYPEQDFLFPHNQYLSILAAMGLWGLALFLFLALLPLWREPARVELWVFHLIMLSSFLTENTLFISVGSALYTLGSLSLLKVEGHKAT